jgi:acid phosphatase type 7
VYGSRSQSWPGRQADSAPLSWGQNVFLILILFLLACQPRVLPTPPPADAPAELVALTGAAVMIGVGDIAACDSDGDELTAAIVDSVLKADSVANVHNVVFTLGDNAYPSGSDRDFALCFGPSWGDSAKRIMRKVRPSPGNHEHAIFGAAAYYEYFGKSAGPPQKGYYSYELGEWHVIALNSEIVVNGVFTAIERQAQLDWLADDLKANKKKCTVAYWHHPRFSSGWHGSDRRIEVLWGLLYDGGADLILNGHDHHYERFRPMSPAGLEDSTRGIVQILAGTGGGELRGLNPLVANSAAQVQGHFGVLKLTLGAEEWRSAFLGTNGRVYDGNLGRCH